MRNEYKSKLIIGTRLIKLENCKLKLPEEWLDLIRPNNKFRCSSLWQYKAENDETIYDRFGCYILKEGKEMGEGYNSLDLGEDGCVTFPQLILERCKIDNNGIAVVKGLGTGFSIQCKEEIKSCSLDGFIDIMKLFEKSNHGSDDNG